MEKSPNVKEILVLPDGHTCNPPSSLESVLEQIAHVPPLFVVVPTAKDRLPVQRGWLEAAKQTPILALPDIDTIKCTVAILPSETLKLWRPLTQVRPQLAIEGAPLDNALFPNEMLLVLHVVKATPLEKEMVLLCEKSAAPEPHLAPVKWWSKCAPRGQPPATWVSRSLPGTLLERGVLPLAKIL